MSNLETAMKCAQLESEVHEMRMQAQQLRKFLAGALCSVCGEPLGTDIEIIQNDDEETMHAGCEDEQGDASK